MTDDYRLKQSRDQAKAIELRGQTKVTRAGDRDTDYGYQNFINPDGSQSRAGVKTYNAEIPSGTPVLATPRSDGLTTLQSLKADPSSKVVPKIFGYPDPKPETLALWALGLQDIGNDNGSKKLFLLNLKTGASYPIAEWPKKIPPCPLAYPDPADYPDWPTQYPGWRVAYKWTETWTSYTNENINSNTNGTFTITNTGQDNPVWVPINAQPPRLVVGSDSNGITWQVVIGSTVVSNKSQDPDGIITTAMSLSGVAIAQMRGGPPGTPTPDTPPPTEPRDNEATYTLSLTALGIPIARVLHTPPCKENDDYGFDKYFKLESIGSELKMKEYPGDSELGDWRNDAPEFRCKGDLGLNPWIEFSADRSYYWYAEETIPGSYDRPSSITVNAPPIQIKASKIFTPATGKCLITGDNPRTAYAYYSGPGVPQTLSLESIAGYGI